MQEALIMDHVNAAKHPVQFKLRFTGKARAAHVGRFLMPAA